MTALTLPRSRATLRFNGGLIVAAVCALPLLLNFLLLTEPFDRDEGAYATIAAGLFDGQLPYRDLFDHKPPLIYGWYALSFAVFGEFEWAPRLMGGLVLSATAYLVYDSARILYSVRAAQAAALVFSLSTGVAVLEPAANVEPFLLLPLAGMLRLFLVRDGQSSSYLLFGAGLLGGLSLLTKEVAIWNVAAVFGLIALSSQGRRWPRSLAFVSGVLLPVAITAFALWALGAASDAAYANVRYNMLYSSTVNLETKLQLAARGIPTVLLFGAPIAAVAFAGFLSASRRRARADRVVLVWALASFLGVASTGRFLPHYFIQALPACGLLAAALVADGIDWRSWGPPRRRATIALATASVVFALALNFRAYAGPGAFERQGAKGISEGGRNAFSNEEIGGYLRERTTSAERVWQAGRESGMYFSAGRQPAVPMFYDRPFWLDPQTLEVTLAELRLTAPVYVVDALSSVEEYEADHPVVLAIRAFIAERYDFETEISYASIYRRKP